MLRRKNDGLDPARGILNGFLGGLIFWIALGGWAAIFYFHIHV